MPANEFIPLTDVKISTEKEVKQRPSIEELTTVESPGKPVSAASIEENLKPKKARKGYSKKSKVAKEKVDFEEVEISSPKRDSILIITEKPQAALKIASALGNPRKYTEDTVSYYEVSRNDKKIIVASAVGHLFNLTYKEGQRGWPIFEVVWVPSYEHKSAAFTKKYYNVLKKLARRAKEFIVATDYDTEGEVIGWNVLRFICKQNNAKRMKYSTLTKPELEKSFDSPLAELDWGNARAGETRHYIDWFYGINLSRALMSAIKTSGSFKILSIGRVQGPALKIIVDKEREIENFKSEPYWQVLAMHNGIEFKHPEDIFDKKQLKQFKNIKEADAETKKTEESLTPPVPFDLTTLQREAYRLYKINPSETLKIAQKLYLDGLISYPRTSSQKIPKEIEPKKILKALEKVFPEAKEASRSVPIEGEKSDPAHPSIYPTGDYGRLEEREEKLYNLIARRFISAFSNDAITANKRVTLAAGKLKFKASGLKVLEKGWTKVYPATLEENDIPDVNGKVKIDEIKILDKETQPPKRYTPASLITILEKKSLGTKCLTADTKIILNDKEVCIKDIFGFGKHSKNEKDREIRKINIKTLSLNRKIEAIVSNSNLISKRKKRETENVIEIKTPNSIIKATEDHLVYTYDNKLIEKKPIGNLRIGDKIIALTKHYQEGEKIFELSQIGDRYKIKDDNIVHKFGKSKNGIKLANFPIRWSTSLAWILGYFYGDGSYSNPKYNGSHQIYFTTTEKKALNLLKENIKNVFGNEPYCYDLKRAYKVDCNSAMSAVLIKIFPSLEGKHPIEIPQEFIGDFLRGFFDADGNVHLRPEGKTRIMGADCNSFATPRIKITLANKELIAWVSALLNKLKIENHINKNISKCNGKTFDCWTILISGKERVERFAIKIGFDSYKEEILYKGLKCNSPHYEVLKNAGKIYFALNKGEFNPDEISKMINTSRYRTMYSVKHLFKLGLISKRRIGNRSKQKWVYSLKDMNLMYNRYYIKLLFEKIDKNVYAAPIESISKENYQGDLYDISVNEDSPNFLVSGNTLVHNSTRSSIIDTLFDRGYLDGTSIKATPLGLKLIEALEKHSPIILDENLTRQLEEEMEEVHENKDKEKKENEIIEKVKRVITDISKEFKIKEKEIGQDLLKGIEVQREQQTEANTLNQCPKCKKGNLRILFNRASRRYFVACSGYPECKTTFTLPPNSLMKKAENKICESCGWPKLLAIRKAKRPWELCFNPECEIVKKQRAEWEAKKANWQANKKSEEVKEKSEEQ